MKISIYNNTFKNKRNAIMQNNKNISINFRKNLPVDVFEKKQKETNLQNLKDRFDGCILGGAIGDAFGVPVEFKKKKQITKLYGENGLRELLVEKNTGKAKFSDDTQMTLFTIDGLIKSCLKFENSKIDPSIIFKSYRDWFETCALGKKIQKGWISGIEEIRGTKGSGKTTMKSLATDKFGTLENPLNNSSSCGGVMRSAPIGLMYHDDPEKAFETAMECAITTHGHPDAYLSAGVYAAIIANLVQGKDINKAIDNTMKILAKKSENQRVLNQIELARLLAQTDVNPCEAIESIGMGWKGDGAIADAIYCVLKTPDDFLETIINAINHSGDSDTVASIAGSIVGAKLGLKNIPESLQEKIELRDELLQASEDLLEINNANFNRKHLYLID